MSNSMAALSTRASLVVLITRPVVLCGRVVGMTVDGGGDDSTGGGVVVCGVVIVGVGVVVEGNVVGGAVVGGSVSFAHRVNSTIRRIPCNSS